MASEKIVKTNTTVGNQHLVNQVKITPVGNTKSRLAGSLKYAVRMADSRPRSMVRPATWVYLFECEGFIKVGVACDVKQRMEYMQVGCPFEIKLLACKQYDSARAKEREIHDRLDQYRVRGEWFKLPAEIITTVLD